jgi:hypothetical protein
MSIEAMRQALEVLDSFEPWDQKLWMLAENIDVDKTIKALREAIAEAERREAERIRPKGKSWLTVGPGGNIEMRELK